MKPSPHQSFFTYAITRPYPFSWFTPVVLTGLLGFSILFSLVNFVATGSTLISEVSGDPNVTTAENKWFEQWPSFLTSKSQSACQTFNLPVNSEFSTNQSALTYILTKVWQPVTDLRNITRTYAPSLAYYNNVLENCTIRSIEIDLEAMDRSANQIAYAEWGVVVRSYGSCGIQGPSGAAMFNMTQEYNYVPPSMSFSGLYQFLGSGFIERDKESRASLWWGESLLSAYWALLAMRMQNIRQNATKHGEPAIRKGTLSFSRNEPLREDLTSPDFFQVDYRFIIDKTQGMYDNIHPGDYSGIKQIPQLVKQSAHPNIWIYADRLAKSAYSTILVDLGQVNASPNILTNATALQLFTADFGNLKIGKNIANTQPGPATGDYATLRSQTGPLNLTASTINAKYWCQVPQRKSTGNLLVSILLADLVFLQSLWQLFKVGVEYFFVDHRDTGDAQRDCDRGSARPLNPKIAT